MEDATYLALIALKFITIVCVVMCVWVAWTVWCSDCGIAMKIFTSVLMAYFGAIMAYLVVKSPW